MVGERSGRELSRVIVPVTEGGNVIVSWAGVQVGLLDGRPQWWSAPDISRGW